MFPMRTLYSSSNVLLTVPNLHSLYSADRCVLSGTSVVSIQDTSGKNEVAMTVPVGNPVYNALDPLFNYKPTFTCTSAARRVETIFNNPITQGYTIYLVMRVETNANTVYWRTLQGNFDDSAGFYLQSDLIPRAQTRDGGSAITSTNALVAGTNYVSCIVYNTTSSALYFNDSQTPNASAPTDGSVNDNPCNGLTMGTFTGQPASYTWALSAQYSGAHDASTRSKIMKYLGNKYGISIT